MDTKRKTKQIPVPVYFNPTTFAEISEDAKKAGKRPVMILDKRQKEHGFANEFVWNIKGIGGFLKECWKYWKRNEAERLLEKAKLAQEEKELLERKKKLGLV
jgi:hypothetical protein